MLRPAKTGVLRWDSALVSSPLTFYHHSGIRFHQGLLTCKLRTRNRSDVLCRNLQEEISVLVNSTGNPFAV